MRSIDIYNFQRKYSPMASPQSSKKGNGKKPVVNINPVKSKPLPGSAITPSGSDAKKAGKKSK